MGVSDEVTVTLPRDVAEFIAEAPLVGPNYGALRRAVSAALAEPEPPHRPDDRILPRNMTVPEPEPAARPTRFWTWAELPDGGVIRAYFTLDAKGRLRIEDES
jgi:hypothetical protein